MGKYDNVTMKEYMKKKKEMLDDLGRHDNRAVLCYGVSCDDCPLSKQKISCTNLEFYTPDKALEIVMGYEPKVERDTKVLVADDKEDYWYKRYFAKFMNIKKN